MCADDPDDAYYLAGAAVMLLVGIAMLCASLLMPETLREDWCGDDRACLMVEMP